MRLTAADTNRIRTAPLPELKSWLGRVEAKPVPATDRLAEALIEQILLLESRAQLTPFERAMIPARPGRVQLREDY